MPDHQNARPLSFFTSATLALLAGALLTLCQPPWNFALLAPVALLPLLALALRSRAPARWGWLAGTMHFTTLLGWVSSVMTKHGPLSPPVAAGLTLLLGGVLGLYVALFTGLLGWCARRGGVSAALLVAPFLPKEVKFVVDMDSDLGEQLADSKSVFARLLGPLADSLHQRSLARADLAIVINARLEEAARRERPTLPVHRLEDPPLVSALTDVDREAAVALRAKLDLGDAPIALYTGNFEAYQGVEMMAHAAALSGRSLSDFVVSSAQEAASRMIREHAIMSLGARDQRNSRSCRPLSSLRDDDSGLV